MLRILLVAGLLTVSAAAVVPTALGDALVFYATGPADSAWALRMTSETPGQLYVLLSGSGAADARNGFGFSVLDANGADLYSTYGMAYRADEGVHLVTEIDGVPSVTVATSDPAGCAYCATDNYLPHPAGTFYLVVWGAGFDANEVAVVSRSDPPATVVAVAQGSAAALSNEDFDGQLGAHAAQTAPTGHNVAANALLDASIAHSASGRMFGMFLSYDPKSIDVSPRAGVGPVGTGVPFGVSISKDHLVDPLSDAMCRGLIGAGCATREISWDGPGTLGGSGGFFYFWTSTPAGDYTFDVARQLSASTNAHIGSTEADPMGLPEGAPDAYGPADTNLYEARVALMFADVELP